MAAMHTDPKNLAPDHKSNYYPVKLTRIDKEGLIFLTCADIPDFFVTLLSEDDIHDAVQETLKIAFADISPEAQVFTNGRIDGPSIETVVRIN
jgi:hypothetical protein